MPLYVTNLDAEKNIVIVGPKESLAIKNIFLEDMNWICSESYLQKNKYLDGKNVYVKLRNSSDLKKAKLFFKKNNAVKLELESEEFGIASGQALE